MSSIRQEIQESPEQWLARLKRIEPSGLPTHARCALALSIGYARHLMSKTNDNDLVSADLICFRALGRHNLARESPLRNPFVQDLALAPPPIQPAPLLQ